MKVIDAMSRDVRMANPGDPISQIAKIMDEIDAGVIPIAENDRLVGMVTDRDIVLRAVALGLGPDTPARDVMTPDVKYCYDQDEIDVVARNMSEQLIRRLPVLNKDKRLVGIISLGDVAITEDAAVSGDALCGISKADPSGE